MKDPVFKVVNRLLISLIHSNAKRIYFNLLLTFSLLFSRVQKVLYDLATKMQSCIALFTLLIFHNFTSHSSFSTTSLHTLHFPTVHFTSHSSFSTLRIPHFPQTQAVIQLYRTKARGLLPYIIYDDIHTAVMGKKWSVCMNNLELFTLGSTIASETRK